MSNFEGNASKLSPIRSSAVAGSTEIFETDDLYSIMLNSPEKTSNASATAAW